MHTRSLRDAPAGTLAVAVVLTGQLRSFGELAVQDSIVQLRRLFNRTDVFAFVSLVDSFSTAQTSASILGPRDPRSAGRNALGRKGCHRLLSDPKIRTAMAKLNPVAIATFNDSDVPCLPAGPCHRVPHNRPDGHWTYYWPMYWAEQRGYALVTSHEATVGLKYDAVVRARPDMQLQFLPSEHAWKMWQAFADADAHLQMDTFALMTRAAAGIYFRAAAFFVADRCKMLTSEDTCNAADHNSNDLACSPAWSTQCFLQTLLSVQGKVVRNFNHTRMRAKIIRPSDISASGAVPWFELWPATCAYPPRQTGMAERYSCIV